VRPRACVGFDRVRLNSRKTRLLSLALLVTLISFARFTPYAEAASRNKFLIASDIHFDPVFDPALVADLAAADPSQWETILQRTAPDRFSLYGQDTNWWLLQSALDQMRKQLPHPAFVMINGDLLAHRFPSTYRNTTHDEDREHYRAFVRKTVEFLALELRKRFPDTKILLTPGNNDEECGDYSIQAGGTFLSDTAQLVRDLAGADEAFATDWKGLGSYNVPHPTIPGFRILSLNTIFFSNNYHATSFSHACATVPSTAPTDLLAWLESNLTQARLANQKTWLMFHIAPGIDGFATIQNRATRSEATAPSAAESCAKAIVPMWVPEWTARFDKLLETFHETVVASFAGHTHSDNFRLINTAGVNQAFVIITPAISPIYDQNPSFRIVQYGNDGALIDQSTYYLTNLKDASSKIRGRWKKEYTFSREWRSRRLDLASLGTVYTQIQGKKQARDQWLKLYNVSSTAAVVPGNDDRGLYCAVAALDPVAYASCYCRATAPQP
jgi:sphingomyelin phosphodiesterase acid-like 3